MPIAGPATAATIGFASDGSVRKRCAAAGSCPAGRGFRKSARSLPALKHARVPWSSTARTFGASAAAASASPSWRYISAVKAFFFSGRSSPIRATASRVSARTKLVVFHLLPQRQLRELAGGGMRQLGDEYHVVGHPPLGDLALVEAQELVFGNFLPRLLHRHHDRPLVPFRVLHADDRRFGNRGMRYGNVFQIDGADPFAARFDDIFGAVGDLDVAVGIDGADVPRGEPAVLQRIAALALEVALDHPGPAHLQVAERFAVPRQLASVLIDDAHVDTEQHPTLLVLQLGALFPAPLHV